ncbi:glycosyltransferase [Halapricum desulfuricans]|uniref:Glycosyltransferase n=1 Tax=Halapricum desulfuricans TaxID=2841257 RepID=A0A897N7E0_9EURY|nr:glycosyltransferase [Halapricum desulfuricans]QSG06959.1 Glycosyltransferase [Halapricum desulfuricans]
MADRSIEELDIAIAHWHINAWGGAEYLVTQMADVLDVDTVYTLGAPSPDSPDPYGDVSFHDVVPSLSPRPLRRLQSRVGRVFEYALWEDVDWREFGDPDVLITSGSTTRAVITPDDTLHLNYCHSPPRWFYDLYHDRKNSLAGQLARPLIRHLRTRDMAVDPRVDHYMANSPVIARRLQKYYKRDSTVVYPPVDLEACYVAEDEGYYLHLGRLDDEKGVPEIVEAFQDIDHRLVLAGGEGDIDEAVRRRIERADNVEYRGFVPESEKYDLLAGCRAVVFNGRNEDFGIVPIEANASGKAVLARNEGFPGLFVEDGENGYFHDGTSPGISDAIKRFEREGVNGDPMGVAEQFGKSQFERALRDTIETQWAEFSDLRTSE